MITFQLLVFAILLVAVSCDVCYDDLGCFETKMRCHDRNPNKPDDIGTTFKLYTRQNPEHGEILDRKNTLTIQASSFDPSRVTNLIVHGWTDSMGGESWITMKTALLQSYDVNVVMVDWSTGANKGYYKSRANTRVVGREIAKLVEAFQAATGATLDSMHIIGHSLGAHIGGYAGEACSSTIGMIGRVSGLDPAGPDFSGDLDNTCRLDKTDALFVDVIHTDGETLWGGGLGLMDQLGHQDFFPNNGQEMPGCSKISISCDHSRAVEYYIESISSTRPFSSMKVTSSFDTLNEGLWWWCSSVTCPDMGYEADPNSGEGMYYLETNDKSPYCM